MYEMFYEFVSLAVPLVADKVRRDYDTRYFVKLLFLLSLYATFIPSSFSARLLEFINPQCRAGWFRTHVPELANVYHANRFLNICISRYHSLQAKQHNTMPKWE